MTKPNPIPPVGLVGRTPLSKMEHIYLSALLHWYSYKSEAPSLSEFRDLCRRSRRHLRGLGRQRGWPSVNAVRRALLSLENKGYVLRNNQGRFEIVK